MCFFGALLAVGRGMKGTNSDLKARGFATNLGSNPRNAQGRADRVPSQLLASYSYSSTSEILLDPRSAPRRLEACGSFSPWRVAWIVSLWFTVQRGSLWQAAFRRGSASRCHFTRRSTDRQVADSVVCFLRSAQAGTGSTVYCRCLLIAQSCGQAFPSEL